MSTATGFKQSDAGLIPKDWTQSTIGSHVNGLVAGVSVNSKSAEYDGDLSVPSVLKTSAVTGGKVISTECKAIADRDLSRAKTPLRADSVIISRMNTPALVGECGYAAYAVSNLYLPDRLWLAEFRRGDATSARWLAALLSSPAFAPRIKAEATGTSGTMKNIPKGPFLALAIPYPPPREQKLIAAALGDIDELIASLDELITKKRDIKQAAMQQLLTGKTRLPGFSGLWKSSEFGKVVKIRNEKHQTLGFGRARFCVELEHIGQANGTLIGFADAIARSSVKYIFEHGDVLFGRLRPYLRKHWLSFRSGVCSTEIWPLIPIDKRITPSLLYQIVQSDAFVEAASTSYGTHMPRADWSVIRALNISLPAETEEQDAIGDALSSMEAEVTALIAKRDKLLSVKDGMLQQLLTGRIRLI